MARPHTPLIARTQVIETALAIIDRDGVDALSIRALGARLGVNGSSLYHHFADKQAILDEVVALILSDLETLLADTSDVDEWIVEVSVQYRRALLNHPNAIQLVEGQFPPQYRKTVEGVLFAHFEALELGRPYWYPLVEQIQAFNFGSAYFTRVKRSTGRSDPLLDEAHFRVGVRALFRGLLAHYGDLSALGSKPAG